jgi:toxin ParE1/3/4
VKRIIVHSEARAELDEAVAYYERQQTGLGLRLLSAVELSVARIGDNPQLGAPYKDTVFRRTPVGRFPYIIFYAEFADAIWVIAVAHGRRRPEYWRQRQLE